MTQLIDPTEVRETAYVAADETCFGILDRKEVDAVLGLPIRVQHIYVWRDFQWQKQVKVLGFAADVAGGDRPPMQYICDSITVREAQETMEAYRSAPMPAPPPAIVVRDGVAHVEPEHPILEAIPYGIDA